MQDMDFFKELLAIFKGECEEHIETMKTCLKDLEQNMNSDKQIEVAEVIHRAAHSLKGAARTIGLVDIEPICQTLETNFSVLKNQKMTLPSELFENFDHAVVLLGEVLASIDESGKVVADKSELVRIVEEVSGQMVQYRK